MTSTSHNLCHGRDRMLAERLIQKKKLFNTRVTPSNTNLNDQKGLYFGGIGEIELFRSSKQTN